MPFSDHQISASRLIKMDAAHRVWGHENKCADLHGHEYWFKLTARGTTDKIGRVIDYSVLKSIIGSWVDQNWDHGTILHHKDPLAEWFAKKTVIATTIRECPIVGDEHEEVYSPLYGQKFFVLPFNPTAENLASYLLKVANELLVAKDIIDVEICRVTCTETSNCSAMAEL